MAKSTAQYTCTECGWTTIKWVGRCGECQQWGTVEDAAVTASSASRVRAAVIPEARRARPITEIDRADAPRWSSGVGELDRVLGGGIVPGATILCSGEPGVGKSTLLLEVASQSARVGRRVLYVSGEESVQQVRLRAERTSAVRDGLFLASETDLATVLGHIQQVEPDLVIIDSVQTIANGDNEGLAGGASQVRDVAAVLTRVAKTTGVPMLLVGHVTKDGTIAGPRLLEHLVDVVTHFDGDRQTALRFIRSTKNRFGPTDEIGCFEMTGEGIHEVIDPSGLFLTRRAAPTAGTCITMALEGRRVLPVEVQALVTESSTGQPRRVVNGVDSNRVAMLLAVLQQRAQLPIGAYDVYVSTVGGIRLTEPGADLAIALALASALKRFALPATFAAIGEISLAGEIRPASGAARRATEARRLGYSTILDTEAAHLREAIRRAIALSTDDAQRLTAVPDF